MLGRPLSAALTVPNPYYHPRQSPARLAYSNVVSECQRLGLPPRMLHIGSQSARKTGFIHLDIAQHGSADVLADVRALPFRDGCLDLIVAVAAVRLHDCVLYLFLYFVGIKEELDKA